MEEKLTKRLDEHKQWKQSRAKNQRPHCPKWVPKQRNEAGMTVHTAGGNRKYVQEDPPLGGHPPGSPEAKEAVARVKAWVNANWVRDVNWKPKKDKP